VSWRLSEAYCLSRGVPDRLEARQRWSGSAAPRRTNQISRFHRHIWMSAPQPTHPSTQQGRSWSNLPVPEARPGRSGIGAIEPSRLTSPSAYCCPNPVIAQAERGRLIQMERRPSRAVSASATQRVEARLNQGLIRSNAAVRDCNCQESQIVRAWLSKIRRISAYGGRCRPTPAGFSCDGR
jgi:hypothetical protein